MVYIINIYRYSQIPRVSPPPPLPWDPATKVQNPKPPIPGLKLSNKVDKSRAMPAYVPGVTSPPPLQDDL